MRILVLTKRQYTNKDLIDDRFGRVREIPLALARRGHHVRGICLSYAHRPSGVVNDGPVRWHSVNAGRLKIPGLLQFIRLSSSECRQADVIWACSDSIYGIIGRRLSRLYRKPLVFDLYDNFEDFAAARMPVVNRLYRAAVRRADAVTVVSLPLSRLIASYGRIGGVWILENGVRTDLFRPMNKSDCRRRLGLPVDAAIVGTAGSLDRNRGIAVLYSAFRQLKSRCPNLHLAVAGPRDTAPPEGEGIHDLGVLPLEAVPTLFNALDVAVICNQDNAFGRYCHPQKAGEIMACNVPLVAARVGSMAQIFQTNPDWLYEPDNVGSLLSAISARLRKKAIPYPAVPTWDDQAAKLEQCLAAVLQ